MKLIDKLANYVFKKTTPIFRGNRKTMAIADAKTVGILFDATDWSEVRIIEKFVETLLIQGKAVRLFGFYNKKKLPPDYFSLLTDDIITRSDLNWIGIPKKDKYASMANEPFDLLLTLCTWHCMPLLMVSAASKAKFRIGRYFSDSMHCFDFMLNIESDTSLDNFLTQILTFSTKMNT